MDSPGYLGHTPGHTPCVPTLAAPAVLNRAPYWLRARRLFGPAVISYLPLDDLTGTTARDASGNSRPGTYGGATGPTLGAPGVGDNRKAVSFPGSAAFCSWGTAGLISAFNAEEGTAAIWLKVASAEVWADSTARRCFNLAVDNNNRITLVKSNVANTLSAYYVAGSTQKYVNISTQTTDWMHLAITWSKAADQVVVYFNGQQQGAAVTELGTWVGNLIGANCAVGAQNNVPNLVWSGSLAHALLLNRPATAAEIWKLYAGVKVPLRLTVIGDSISDSFPTDWPYWFSHNYNGGHVWLTNHAVAGNSVMAGHLAAQVAAAAGDQAQLVIVGMGTNDNDAGDMEDFQAAYEAQLAALKAAQPSAAIYVWNILPRWTAVDGVTEVDKSHLRTAIAAACTAQQVTCLDTYTDPWITAADTIDGLHPGPGGGVKIADEIMALLGN